MKGAVTTLLYLEYAVVALAASAPRGVGPKFARFYEDQNNFACISHPAITIPFSRVNDDYCDCPDGSDEPGTSACAHLSSLSPRTLAEHSELNATLALPGFYCQNKGHIPSYVPFTSVNDGICDYDLCCDGSEEWEGVGATKCKDKCDEIGKEWKKQDAARQKSLSTAAKKRAELVKEAARLKQEVINRMQGMGAEIEGAELKVKQTEEELADILRKESSRRSASSSSEPTTRLGQLVQVARKRMDELREMLLIVKMDRDSQKGQFEELYKILKKFKEEYNPNFNDEGVKRAVRAWDDFVANLSPFGADESQEASLTQLLEPDSTQGLNWDEFEDGETNILYSFEAYLPPSLRTWIHGKLHDLRVMLVEGGILAESSGSGQESQRVRDARSRLVAAKNDLEGHHKTQKESQEDLEKDYGPDDVFRALRGQCVSTDSGEYTYEVCFLDRTKQKPKKGGSDTNMGNFISLDKITVDEELPINGKGLGSGERIVMKHEDGQHCWNGPNRSTFVILACSEENEVWKIMEEEKCVYRMEVGTPAVCPPAQTDGSQGGKRDEL